MKHLAIGIICLVCFQLDETPTPLVCSLLEDVRFNPFSAGGLTSLKHFTIWNFERQQRRDSGFLRLNSSPLRHKWPRVPLYSCFSAHFLSLFSHPLSPPSLFLSLQVVCFLYILPLMIFNATAPTWKALEGFHSPVSRGSDEVKAAVDSAVGHLSPVHARLRVQVVLKLAVYVVDDRLPAAPNKETLCVKKQTIKGDKERRCRSRRSSPVAVVDGISEPRGVDYREQQLDPALLY